jgi:sugar phosphate isomerase/epimerase
MGDVVPFNSLESICKWAASLGFKGVQIPSWDARCIDLKKAAESKTYADEIKGIVASAGMEITELSTHLQGQLIAVNPAYDAQFDGFAPKEVHGNSKARTEWAVQQLKYAAQASQHLVVHYYGTRCILGHKDQQVWWKLDLQN